MKLCECGCGREVKNRFIRGHHVRINNPMNDIKNREKISKTKISKGLSKGKNNPMYGKKGKDNPNYGSKRTKEQKRNISNGKFKYGCTDYYRHIAYRIVKENTSLKEIRHPINIHHIDGDVKNNRKSNLLVCVHGYHNQLHHKIREVYGENWREVFKK